MQSTRNLLPATQARRETRRAAFPVPYLILLQAGFTMQPALRPSPVVSYTTFSPLPFFAKATEGKPSFTRPQKGGIFSVALSVPRASTRSLPALRRDALPCGVRTFLPPSPRLKRASPRKPVEKRRPITSASQPHTSLKQWETRSRNQQVRQNRGSRRGPSRFLPGESGPLHHFRATGVRQNGAFHYS